MICTAGLPRCDLRLRSAADGASSAEHRTQGRVSAFQQNPPATAPTQTPQLSPRTAARRDRSPNFVSHGFLPARPSFDALAEPAPFRRALAAKEEASARG
jgi:hypothetical protein